MTARHPEAGVPDPLSADAGATRWVDPATGEAEASYARYRAEDRSLGEIASDLLDNASTLIRQEVALAKVEAGQAASRAGKGVGLMVGAGVTALLGLIALTLTLWWAIAIAIGTREDPALGWSGLIVTALWLILAGILLGMGRSELKRVRGLPKTQETLSKIPNAATGNEEKNR